MAKRIQRKVTAPARAAAPKEGGGEARARAGKPGGRRVSGEAVTDFTVQLATLTGAGIPIVRALSVLHGQTPPGPFKQVLAEVTEDVASGTPLSEALGKHGRAFDHLYAAMVRAGESGGLLDAVLTRLAALRERAAVLRSRLKGAMIYPSVIVLVALVVIAIVIVFVIPRFQEIFTSFDVELPGTTRLLLNLSSVATRFWYLIFGVPVLLWVLHRVAMTRGGGYRFRVHGLQLRLPLVGLILRRGFVAGFSRTFGTLVQAGVPHLDALAIARDTAPNDVVSDAVETIRRTVREGEAIAPSMADSGVFDDLVCNMVEVGEETGELDGMLLRVAEAYEAQVDRKLDALVKVLEPGLLIVMAIFVGFVVVALFMPLLEIMNNLRDV